MNKKAKRTTTVSIDFTRENIKNMLIREIQQTDKRFADMFPQSNSGLEITNNDTVFKLIIQKDEYLK